MPLLGGESPSYAREIPISAIQNLICDILGYSSFPNYLSVDVGLDRSASLRDLSILFLLAFIFAGPYCAFLLSQQRADPARISAVLTLRGRLVFVPAYLDC